MADIRLQNRDGSYSTFSGVDTIILPTSDGGAASFSSGGGASAPYILHYDAYLSHNASVTETYTLSATIPHPAGDYITRIIVAQNRSGSYSSGKLVPTGKDALAGNLYKEIPLTDVVITQGSSNDTVSYTFTSSTSFSGTATNTYRMLIYFTVPNCSVKLASDGTFALTMNGNLPNGFEIMPAHQSFNSNLSQFLPDFQPLSSITIGENVTAIPAYFASSRLISHAQLLIPEGVISIGNSAFNRNALTNVDISSSVETIGNSCFSDCTELTSMTCRAVTPPTLGMNGLWNVPADCPIYVPEGSVSAYQSATEWRSRSAYIQAIPS